MKNEILTHQQDPAHLEKLYRSNKVLFKREFTALYPELKGKPLAEFWNERLNFENEEINWGSKTDLLILLIGVLIAGFIVKIPAIFNIGEEHFYTRNAGFIFLPLLTAYFAWKNNLQFKRNAIVCAIMLISLIYINILPASDSGDTLLLACIHLPLFLWVLTGSAFTGSDLSDHGKRLDFLKYNGDLVVMTSLILIAGGIMTGLTIGLFELIGFHIENLYFQNIALIGLASSPLIGTYLTQTNPQLVSRVSPVIARIFSPLVLVTLVIYLGAIIFSGKDPYNDREFLIIFNLLLIGVMAIIFFSVAESSGKTGNTASTWILFLLSLVTIIVSGIAFSAILFRISEWGFTPNRLAVLGSNILMLVNLLLMTLQLFRTLKSKADISAAGRSIALFIPVYCAWAVIVIFLFPVIFGFK